jgi:hypothetical protein
MRSEESNAVPFGVLSPDTPSGKFPHDWNMFLNRWSIVVPPDMARVPGLIDQAVDLGHGVVEREAPEIGPKRKNPVVTLAEVCKDT